MEVRDPPVESVIKFMYSTLATTNSVLLQTSDASSGPWFTEASTSISTAGSSQVSMRLTGPYTWVRPYFQTVSTGTYRIRLLGVS